MRCDCRFAVVEKVEVAPFIPSSFYSFPIAPAPKPPARESESFRGRAWRNNMPMTRLNEILIAAQSLPTTERAQLIAALWDNVPPHEWVHQVTSG
jgi:hypothetical protein